MRIHLNIGSNMGDRMALIGRAVALLSRKLPSGRIYLSDYIESEPWGYESSHPFLNRGVLYVVADDVISEPEALLDITQEVEHIVGNDAPHRNAAGYYCDRPIDIDIISVDDMEYKSERLILPHPRAHLRPFVMIPLGELNIKHPI